MSEILDLAKKFKQKSNETANLIETTLEEDLTKLHASFIKSLSESESIIKQGTESLDEKQTKLQEMLEQHNEAINTLLAKHIYSVQALTTESLEQQRAEIAEMMSEYSRELSETMQAHQAEAFKFLEHRVWAVLIFGFLFALLILILGVVIGMKLG